ncbi:hypothetical protein SOM35_08220 [Curtobacterium sp. CFBP9011]|nr:hypothetical protein [Curtobacterium sp. CFBP9011]
MPTPMDVPVMSRTPVEMPVHHEVMMRRYRLWLAWILGPLLAALVLLTALAAVTDSTPWPPLLAATIACAVAGAFLFALGPRAARQQDRESRAAEPEPPVNGLDRRHPPRGDES